MSRLSGSPSEHLHILSKIYTSPAYAHRVLSWLRSTSSPDHIPLSDSALHDRVHAHVYHHKPLAYILGQSSHSSSTDEAHDDVGTAGWQPFDSLELLTRPPTLIPRPETEEWALRLSHWLSAHAPPEMRVLDIGTGTGCLPLLLASEVDPRKTRMSFTGIDVSHSALSLARENLEKHQREMRHRVDFQCADLFNDQHLDNLGQFDLVLSNPPYISAGEFEGLDESVRAWEDPCALVPSSSSSASDGLECYRRIAAVLPRLLKRDSECRLQAVVEVGWRQAAEVANLLRLDQHHHESRSRTKVWTDAYGQQRTVLSWRSL